MDIVVLVTNTLQLLDVSAVLLDNIAAIRALLKKKTMVELIFKRIRPIWNLPFLWNVIKKVVLSQLLNYMKENNLHYVFQSAYHQFHSTETDLLRHKNYISEMVNWRLTLAFMYDLSVAFDTIDYTIMLQRLSERFGVHDYVVK